MHRCLTILDVLLVIFESQGITSRDLSRLARTCTTFCAPALDILWRGQEGLCALLECMPPDLWNIGTWEHEPGLGGPPRKHMTLRRPIVANDWTRFKFYANRMRTLDLGRSGSGVILDLWDSSALLAAPEIPAMRNIKKLSIDLGAPNGVLMWFRLIARDRIVTLTIYNYYFGAYSEMGTSFLSNMPAALPNVRKFKISYELVGTAVIQTACNGWPQLHKLVADDVDLSATALLSLSALPKLSMLRFDWHGLPEDLWELSRAPSQHRFPALRRLVIYLPDECTLDTCCPLLALSKFPQLEEINCFEEAEEGSANSVSAWNLLLTTLGNACSPTTIKKINLGEESKPEADPPASWSPTPLLDIASLEPLLPFRHLVEFSCSAYFAFDLGDADVEKMARAWPSLNVLELAYDLWGWRKPSRITIKGLMSLIRLCPDLARLSIVINASAVNIPFPNDLPVPANDKLITIALQNSEIDDPSAIAALFSTTLPNLRSIKYWCGTRPISDISPTAQEIEQYRARWAEVEKVLSSTDGHNALGR
ncbi:hypothetical protein PLICRDRAFT_87552 [Plicaturopsis crispa FD-325 SS-3]|nr:hypothetical protein PLICRDRAFT_87552 [Plicaturopsis crispa FD-325 SS-3]